MSDISEADAIRKTKEYQAAKAQLADREWRIENLYWIKNKDGREIPFRRNFAQRLYDPKQWFRDTILKARKLGFSTFVCIEILDASLFASNTESGIIDYTLKDAKAKLQIIKFAYRRLPESIRRGCYLVRENDEKLEFSNGSVISVGTSYRGGTPQKLLISEYGKIAAQTPDVAREIRTGAFPAVPSTGKIWVESTAKGTAGEFRELVKTGEEIKALGTPLTPLDFRLHFFAWWMDPDNVTPSQLVIIPQDMRIYFDELRIKHGITLNASQEAWYVKTRKSIGPDDMLSEHPSIPEEAFYASLEGAYFKREMNLARKERRIGLVVPHDPSRPVNTFWDIGVDDENAIGFHQTDGVRHRFVDFYRSSGHGIAPCIDVLEAKAKERGFRYGVHYGPHDLKVRDWGNLTGQSRFEIAAENGVKFHVVDRIPDKASSIDMARRMINTSYFCEEHAAGLVECLDNYSKKWNDTLAIWMDQPAKNGFQHGADAFQQIAMGLLDSPVLRDDQFTSRRRGSHWSN